MFDNDDDEFDEKESQKSLNTSNLKRKLINLEKNT